MRIRSLLIALALTPLGLVTASSVANDTTFTYQGSLKDGGTPADGFYDATFRLYSAVTGGSLLGTTSAGIDANDGVFSVELDFGAAAWNNTDRWLEIEVSGDTLSPRQPVTRSPYAIQTRGIYVDDAGHVGLGGTLTTSTEMLTIRDEDANILLLSQGNDFGPKITMRSTASGISTVHGRVIFDDGAQLASIGYVKPLGSPAGLAFGGALNTNMKITESGLIGIGGEFNPLSLLHVQTDEWSLGSDSLFLDDIVIESSDAVLGLYSGPGGTRGSTITMGEVSGGVLVDKWSIGRNTNGSGSAIAFKYGTNANYTTNTTMFVVESDSDAYFPSGARLGVGTHTPQATLDVNGTARVHVLEVLGADLAERFETSTEGVIEPGTVLEIDPENPGMLRVASSAYSTLVAGVVSGANGLPAGTIMGNLPGCEDATPIALTGRVWVMCDAATGEIEPGDMLTTSATPGCAMSASDRDRATGAVIGKAMTGLDAGESGLVLVLVNLQ